MPVIREHSFKTGYNRKNERHSRCLYRWNECVWCIKRWMWSVFTMVAKQKDKRPLVSRFEAAAKCSHQRNTISPPIHCNDRQVVQNRPHQKMEQFPKLIINIPFSNRPLETKKKKKKISSKSCEEIFSNSRNYMVTLNHRYKL